jgi:hypothetical protein
MRICVALLALATLAGTARADDDDEGAEKGTLGLGLILGEPTGITAKLYLADDRAIQAAVGFAFIGGGIQGTADYLFHPYILQKRESFVLPFYVGPGVRLISYDDGRQSRSFASGVRVVAGLVFDFKHVPIDVFVEAAAVGEYWFKDGKGLHAALNAAAGARYYF